MWAMKLKVTTEKTRKQTKFQNIGNSVVFTRGKGGGERVGVKEVKYTVMKEDLTLSGGHTM